MSESLKITALFLWVLSAIYIKEDAQEKVRNHPVVYHGYTISAPESAGDSTNLKPAEMP